MSTEPNIPAKSLEKYEYNYQLFIEKTENIRLGDPWHQFVIEAYDKVSNSPAYRLSLPYVCSGGAFGKCAAHFQTILNGKKKSYEVSVFALNKKQQETSPISSRKEAREDEFANILIFPDLSRQLYSLSVSEENQNMK